ncbi:MAG: hypothetical protein QW272_09075 [Candidatus Methanomethylicaceae archaeon]
MFNKIKGIFNEIKIKDVKDIPYDALLNTLRKIHDIEEYNFIIKHIDKLKDKSIERVIEYFEECNSQFSKILLSKFSENELREMFDKAEEETIVLFMYKMKKEKNKKEFSKEELKNFISLIDSIEAIEKGLVNKEDGINFIAIYMKRLHEIAWEMIKKRSNEDEINQAILNAVNIVNKMVIK